MVYTILYIIIKIVELSEIQYWIRNEKLKNNIIANTLA